MSGAVSGLRRALGAAWRRARRRGADPDAEIQLVPAKMPEFRPPDLAPLAGTRSGMAGHILFLVNLTVQIRARHVVEIGLGGANSACAFLIGLAETGGVLTSIDVERRPEAAARIAALGGQRRWRFIQGTSDEAVREVSRLEPIDILMIDGLHSYNQCRRDYLNYAPLVRPGGYVLFHDSSAIEGVRKFTEELRERGLEGVNLDYCNGLFVLHKRDSTVW
ncbi:MAG: class I SAM-dependent methyltransferase [Acidobacteria bacterium]|nr:MAG: class I SAM-dependent methyltransferase [Acidobacteriota bacterium]